MSVDEDKKGQVQERLNQLKAGSAVKAKKFPAWAGYAATAVGGLAVGSYLMIAADQSPPETKTKANIPTSTSQEFQTGAGGGDPLAGMSFTKKEPVQEAPQIVPAKSQEIEALQDQVNKLTAQLAAAQAASDAASAPDASVAKQLEELRGRLSQQESALADAERENVRLTQALGTQQMLADQGIAPEGDGSREAQLAAARAQQEERNNARIHSDMVAFRQGEGGSGDGSGDKRSYKGDEAFRMAGAKSTEPTQSTVIANPSNTIIQGTVIEAALETAVSTSIAGNMVATITKDVWSYDMSRILVRRGSKLFGRYDTDIKLGQRRVLVVWDRLITTDNQSVNLAAYGTDRVGRSGLPGKVRTHFLQRFGSAALISIIGAIPTYAAEKATDDEDLQDTIEDMGDGFSDATGDVVADYLRIKPTISIDQGQIVMVRVDTDIELF